MVKFYAGRVGGGLALALLMQWGSPLTAVGAVSIQGPDLTYSASYAQKDNKGRLPLRTRLAEVERRYKIRINYVGNTVKGIYADAPPAKEPGTSFTDYLNSFLSPLGLEAEQAAQDQYIIYKKQNEQPSSKAASAAQPAQDIVPVNAPAAGGQAPAAVSGILQQAVITGQVTDETGLPLPGVTIVVKGTFNGTKTGEDGRYKLGNVPPQGILVFSFIGYKAQEVKVEKRTAIDVKLLTEVQSMKDFVVNGYQRLQKDNYTGSAIVITGEELKHFNPQNILQSIQAHDPSFRLVENNLAGSNPNQLPNVNVRGTTALPTGDASQLSRNQLASVTNLPLFMLDGYQVSIQNIFDLDFNRIETVTLLKDAAATAIYGSRASNGVVVIQTKAPKEGQLELYYNYELNVTAPDLTAYSVLDAGQKLEYERLAGLYTENGVDSPDELERQYYAKKRNVLSGVNTYWLAQPVTTDFGHKHSVSLQGGSPTVRYGVDVRYQTNNGVMKGSGRDRYSLSNTLSYNPKSHKLLFRNQFTISQVNGTESPYGSFADYVRMNPYYPIYDAAGRLLREIDKWNYRDAGNNNASALETVLNPMYEATLGSFNKSEYLEFMDAFSVEYNPSPAWRINGNISLIKRKASADKFTSPLSNEFFNDTGDKLKDRGRYSYNSEEYNQVDGSFTINHNRTIHLDHFLNFALGMNMQAIKTTQKGFTARGFTNDRFTDVSFARKYEDNSSPLGGVTEQRLAGAFLSFNYSFQNRFLMDGTLRVDGSSKFGSDSRMAPFWSYGIGWNLHKEKFLQGTFVSQLRLKATTGLTGDVAFPAYLSNTTYNYYNGDWYSTGVGAVFAAYGNSGLKWQRTHNYDLSLELGLFNDRVYFSPRYYHKLTTDLLADINVPPSAGFEKYKENLGEMVNRGFELYMRANVLRGRHWALNLNFNMVRNTNEITKISDALKNYNDEVDKQQQQNPDLRSVPLLRYREGQSLNTIYAVRSLGIDPENGREIFLNSDGTRTYDYDVRNTVPVGDQTPVLDGYFGGNIVYRNFMIEVSFYTRLGGDIYNQTLVDRVENANPWYNADSRVLEARWRQPGDQVFFKDIADKSTTLTSSRFVQQENRVELKSVFLSYEAPASVYKRLKMKNLRCALTMNDLAYWSSVKIERGIDYPFARSFTFSLSTRF
ncbi:SusC/RagA family TonB-linked outer membrane protein [Chitinophaga japonensis]|uniref:TonB-linked SusC/RagA family outer membrane protein n=1 Tax=Chitinophaga japonensis TaxID=104662 RepID=A0A562SI07_CHIJA|nr:SusC/RagA family TonB-linked outer membrane protein [Chitinophaga japonensis]TWI80925.1 TonB-linked SusC/RagA family outer membrane protein [Chitinophaga japonensis]